METTEYSLPELIAKAEHYTASAEHCIMDIQLKLRQWECTFADEQTVISHLIQRGFIDEQRYASAFVHDKLLFHGWGKIKMQAALRAKHIDDSYISAALDNIDETDYFDTLGKVAKSKKNASREQRIRFLLQRGFSYDDIRKGGFF
ncbi:MAG: RecX family transcriptional regulator [Paludibacteraceae bacterium]|nr:RecX family transcriptional regulator [Paludibacteraceae bacterium]